MLTLASQGPVVAPANLFLGANVSDPDGTVVSVEYFSSGVSLGKITAAPWTLAMPNTPAGTYTWTGKATDNGGASTTSAPMVFTVPPDQAPTVRITSPLEGTIFVAPANIPVYGDASDPDSVPDRIEYWSGSTLIGTSTYNTYYGKFYPSPINWNILAPGSYTLTAKAYDDKGASGSTSVHIVVNAPVTSGLTYVDALDYAPGTGFTLWPMAMGDFNGDGKVDVSAGGGDTLFIGQGDGTFLFAGATRPLGYQSAVVGDFNGDGKLDLAMRTTQNVLIRLGNGNGTLQNPTTQLAGTAYLTGLVSGDFNGDGKLDLVTVDSTGTIQFLLGKGDGTLQLLLILPGRVPNANLIAVGDFDGDGKLDLVVTAQNPARAWFLAGFGDGGFQNPRPFSIGTIYPAALAVGDFNSDGKLDVAIADQLGNRVSILLGDGHGGFAAAANTPAGQQPLGLAVGDFDGDGKQDLAVANWSGNVVSILLGDGTGAFRPPIAFAAGPNPQQIFVADLNGDGHPDLVVGNDQAVAVLINTTFATPQAPSFLTSRPPDGVPGVAYNFTARASGFPAPVMSLSAGTLPSGISLLSNGVMGGTPTPGTYAGVITAHNGVAPDATQGFEIVVEGYAQTTTFGALSDRTLGDPPFAVSATATGALVTFSSLSPTVCAVAGTVVTLVGPGLCTIRASAAGNGYYKAAPDVDRTFTVLPTGQTLAIQLTAPLPGSAFSAPGSFTLVALAGAKSPITAVDFFQGLTKVCTLAAAPFTCARSALPAGSYTFTAKVTDNKSVTATSQPVTITVTAANQPPTVAITAPAAGSVFGAPGAFTLTASAADADGFVAGVEFFSGATSLGAVAAPPWTLTLRDLPAGTYTFTAKATDDKGASATSSPVSATVTSANLPPTIQIVSPAAGTLDLNSVLEPVSITLWATVNDPDGAVIGATFFVNGVATCTINDVPGVSGYHCALASVGIGTYSYTAQATDNRGAVATSAPVTVVVRVAPPNIPPVVTLTAPLTGQVIPHGTILFAANASDADGSVARVDFLVDSVVVGTTTTPPYTLGYSPPLDLNPEARIVTARATDDRGAVTVSAAAYIMVPASVAIAGFYPPDEYPFVALTAPNTCGPFSAAGPITIAADAKSKLLSVARVDFFAGSTLVGSANASPFTVTWAQPTAGTQILSAVGYDSRGLSTTSASMRVPITGNQPPTATLTAPAAGSTFWIGQTVTLAANASDPDGSVAKVDFFASGTNVGTATSPSYQVSWSPTIAGTYQLKAVATDNAGATGSSAPVSVTVFPAPTVSLTAPAAGAKFAPGQAVAPVAQASVPGGTINRIEFLADGVVVSTVSYSVPPATATATGTWTAGSPGAHTLTARVVATSGVTAVSLGVAVSVVDLAVNIVEPFANETYLAPGDIRITAKPTETAGTIASVDFYGDGNLLGSRASSPFTFLWTPVVAGSHTVTAKAHDGSGLVSSSSVAVSVLVAPTIQVDPGIDGSTVADDNVFVSGTVQAPPNSAVMVNGRLASLDRAGHFFANNVPLQPGVNTITLAVNTQDAAPVSKTITVTRTGLAPFGVVADPPEGFAPLAVDLTIVNHAATPFGRVEIDTNGDGAPDVTLASLPKSGPAQVLSYPAPGVFNIGVKVFDVGGNLIYQKRVRILARDPAETAALVSHVFNEMLDRLQTNRVSLAVNAIVAGAWDRYRSMFSAPGVDLAAAVAGLGTISSVSMSDVSADIVLTRVKVDGVYAYDVILIRDFDGVWRIEGM